MQNIEVEHLTDDERAELFADPEEALKWLNFTCEIISAIEENRNENKRIISE